jgi:hypothetical protein
MPGLMGVSLSRALFLAGCGLGAVAGCGKSEPDVMRDDHRADSSTEDAGRDASTEAAGVVRCGEHLCDIAAGNQCYACSDMELHCHTPDLPRECEAVATFDGDGPEDCAGAPCDDLCPESEGCSMPSRVCLLL